MKYMYRIAVVLLLFVAVQDTLSGQIVNQQSWIVYNSVFKVSPKWGIQHDLQFRTNPELSQNVQVIGRAGLAYHLRPDLSLLGGYAFVNTYNSNLNAYSRENRMYEQLMYRHDVRKVSMTHRLRLEQRFLGHLAYDSTTQAVVTDHVMQGNRFRYANRMTLNLTNHEKKNVLYAVVQDELFINFANKEINPNVFDRNRFLIGIGVLHNKHTRYELAYMNQYVNSRSGEDVINNILHLAIHQVINFGK
jgi:hypothetical protein